MSLDVMREILSTHFSPKAKEITRFAHTGYSFEEWFNWELFSAFSGHGYTCFPKPAYRKFFAGHTTRFLGDLLIEGVDGWQCFVEVAVVHGYTQNKWRAKMVRDRAKLLELEPNIAGMQKVLLVVFCSSVERKLEREWDYWFKEIPFWAEPGYALTFDDGVMGEVNMRFWSVL